MIARQTLSVQRRRRAQKRQRGIRAARNTNDKFSDMRAFHASRYGGRLNRQDLPVPPFFHILVKEGRRRNGSRRRGRQFGGKGNQVWRRKIDLFLMG